MKSPHFKLFRAEDSCGKFEWFTKKAQAMESTTQDSPCVMKVVEFTFERECMKDILAVALSSYGDIANHIVSESEIYYMAECSKCDVKMNFRDAEQLGPDLYCQKCAQLHGK